MPASTGFWGGISCLLGRHIRSRGQAHATPGGWISRCARCAIPMVRSHGGGKWQVVKTPKASREDAEERVGEVFAKAITRSSNAGKRREDKAAKTIKRVVAAEKARGDEIDELRSASRHPHGAENLDKKGRRRFPFFRRKSVAASDDGGETGSSPSA